MRYWCACMVLVLFSSSGKGDEAGKESFAMPLSLDGYVLVLDETNAELRRGLAMGKFNEPKTDQIEESRWESTTPKLKGFSLELFRDPDDTNKWREARIPYGVQWLVLNPLNGKKVVKESSYRKTGERTADLKFITDIGGGCDTRDEWTFHLSFDAPFSGTVTYSYR